MENGAPNNLFNEQATEEKGEMARLSSFIGAMAIADLVKTTLGPKGMDKILQSQSRGQEVTVTNDGATILKSIYVDNPAAKVLVDISKVQDDQVGDGTTSVVVRAGCASPSSIARQRERPLAGAQRTWLDLDTAQKDGKVPWILAVEDGCVLS